MIKRKIYIFIILLFITGCATDKVTVQEQRGELIREEEKPVQLAPHDKSELLKKAEDYLKQRDYANALINIIQAENAEGDEELIYRVSSFKNNLIEKLNARAIYEKKSVEIDKGLSTPLEYMVFFMEGEVIYPAFNIPVTFKVIKGEAQITGKSFTNTTGVAECEVSKVESMDNNEVVITAGVSLEIGGEIFNISKLQRDFTLYHRSIKEQTISFVVFEENINEVIPTSISGKLIEDFFIENGFSVLHGINENNKELFIDAMSGYEDSLNEYKGRLDSSLIAFTYIQSTFSSKISEGFYFARSSIALKLLNAETNRVIFNSVVEDIKGAGSSEEKAGRKAITEATREFIAKLKNEIASIELNM